MQIIRTNNKEEYVNHQLGHVNVNQDYGLSQWHLPIIDDILGMRKYLAGPLLDIGTRNGLFLDELEKIGIEAHGIEITDAAKLAQSFGRKVIQGDIQERTDYPDKFFKSVVMTHVLEHLEKPYEAMAEIKRILDGYIIICVPMQGGNDEFMAEEGVKHGHHTFFESPEDLKKFVKDCGFEEVEYRNEGMWVQYIIART